MGRNALGKKPMTPAERQRRRRKRLKTERSAEVRKKMAGKARDDRALAYIPMPPGITVWVNKRMKANEEFDAWIPKTRPLAAFQDGLEDDDKNGILIPPRDSAALARAVEELANDPEKCKRYGNASLQRANDEFDHRHVVGEYLKMYEEIWNR